MGTVVEWNQEEICADNAVENINPECSHHSGDKFPLGKTTVVCSCTDGSRNVNRCSFLITIEDNSVSPIICPPNRALVTSAHETTTAVVKWSDISCTNNTDDNIQISCSPRSGSFFHLGKTTVTCTCSDITESKRPQCSFIITVTGKNIFPYESTPRNNCYFMLRVYWYVS
ncbi:Hyalin [Holothuria leucospilota]|uniref:Hyalin n=1 Tax=Holothuria leucospilota TaxID=206669 RepID=A0A9Q1C0Q3_HOLLE|nr:Hyalin [Holothuria leucospilota]